MDPAHTQEWQETRERGHKVILTQTLDAMPLSDRKEELLDWLEDYDIQDTWKLAKPLAEAGIDVSTLEILMERWRDNPTELRDIGIRWLSLSFDVMSMIKNGLRGAKRIFALVHSPNGKLIELDADV